MARTTLEKMYTAQDLADRWGVDRDTVYRIPAMVLPFVRPTPRTRRYRPEEVAEYEQQHWFGGEG